MDIKKITLSPVDESVLKNDLFDIQEWVESALRGKINNCKKRMCREWRDILYADESVTQIPNDNDELVALVVARNDYKNRAEREAKKNPE